MGKGAQPVAAGAQTKYLQKASPQDRALPVDVLR